MKTKYAWRIDLTYGLYLERAERPTDSPFTDIRQWNLLNARHVRSLLSHIIHDGI